MLSFFSISNAHVQIYNYDISTGLPDNSVEVVCHDSYGFIWVGTYGGLAKFDGYKFQNYTIFDSVCSLPGGIVFEIFEDSEKNLWIATNKELMLYDRPNDCFIIFPDFPKTTVTDICQIDNGELWVSSLAGLLQIDPKKKELVKFFTISDGIPSNSLTSITHRKNGEIWVGTHDRGYFSINPSTYKITVFNTYNFPKNALNPGNRIYKLQFDKAGFLWIGTMDVGLFKYDFTSKTYTQYLNQNLNEKLGIGRDFISDIYCDKNNKLWICRNGFFLYLDTVDNKLKKFIPNQNKDKFLSENKMVSIDADNHGNIWLGSNSNGTFFLRNIKNNFTIHEAASKIVHPDTLTINNIRSIIPFGDSIVFSSDENGIFFKHSKSNKITSFKRNKELPSAHIMHSTLHDNKLWCASWSGGVFVLDLVKNSIEKISFHNEAGEKLNIDIIRYLQIFNDTLWVGTSGDGLLLYDITRKKTLSQQFNDTFNLRQLGWISCIHKDRKNRVWISTFNGMYMFDKASISIYNNILTDKNSISSDVIYSIFEDDEGSFWFATNKGLDRYNDSNKEFTHWQKNKIPGLPKV
ncbi:MAG: hypothetical protein IPO21_12410 [Bacteroidales bacterium]|nr:hypothetical protein [Bacteroidales bacterium]